MERANYDLYQDIAQRTDGDVYLGVLGPVRTGKSTFISRLMELMVMPHMPDGPKKERVADELPQSGSGRTIMTTQPQFVPSEAVTVNLGDQVPVRVRLVDSVGYMVRGALGAVDKAGSRMVHTPWFEQDIPFEKAAEIGTRKVMTDHATIGVVVTTDGTIAELPRNAYVEPESRVISELKALGKPFVVVLNSAAPKSREALALREDLQAAYDVPVMLLNAKEMQTEDVQQVLESVLLEFPLRQVHVTLPKWMEALDENHWLLKKVLAGMKKAGQTAHKMRESDLLSAVFAEDAEIATPEMVQLRPGEGRMDFNLPVQEGLFNQILGEECGTSIHGDAHLLSLMKELVAAKAEYDQIAEALRAVRETGYGLVTPTMAEMTMEEPEMIRQGGQFGIRLKAHAPSLHLIRVDVETEVTPTVGTEEQSEELVRQLTNELSSDPQKVWGTSFFGKSLSDMVKEGLSGKLSRMPADAQQKVQETLTRIVNEGDGGMICILL